MFSMTPRIGALSFLNIAIAFWATLSATSCGVETITTPVSGIIWHKERVTSPVPGGVSTTR